MEEPSVGVNPSTPSGNKVPLVRYAKDLRIAAPKLETLIYKALEMKGDSQ